MKKYLSYLLVVLISVLILSACTNPDGRLGPSWDVTAKIPLIKGAEENKVTIEDILVLRDGAEDLINIF